MPSVKMEKIVDKMKLTNFTPELDVTKVRVKVPDINRPALQMAGYFEHIEATDCAQVTASGIIADIEQFETSLDDLTLCV